MKRKLLTYLSYCLNRRCLKESVIRLKNQKEIQKNTHHLPFQVQDP